MRHSGRLVNPVAVDEKVYNLLLGEHLLFYRHLYSKDKRAAIFAFLQKEHEETEFGLNSQDDLNVD
jgi:hypothetical protein